jgi:hypothetical protein
MKKPDKKKILILAANPKLTDRLCLDEEVREIEEALKRSKHGKRFIIHKKWAVRLRDTQRAMLEYEPNIVHFAGHGEKKGLIVEDKGGAPVYFSPEPLSALFELCSKHVECVILNACYSDALAEGITKHIDYVIGMEEKINDKAALEFAVGFYDALGAGKSIDDSFKFGCVSIQTHFPDLKEHVTPVLRKKKKVNIQIRFETTGEMFDFQVPLDERTAVTKNYIIDTLKLAKTFPDGRPIMYYLLNKTTDKIMDDTKTFRENGARDNEVFVFIVETDD